MREIIDTNLVLIKSSTRDVEIKTENHVTEQDRFFGEASDVRQIVLNIFKKCLEGFSSEKVNEIIVTANHDSGMVHYFFKANGVADDGSHTVNKLDEKFANISGAPGEVFLFLSKRLSHRNKGKLTAYFEDGFRIIELVLPSSDDKKSGRKSA